MERVLCASPVRFAIVGLGMMGRLYAQWLRDGLVSQSVLSAAYDPSPAAGQWLRDNCPGTRFFTDYEEMLQSHAMDAVLVATPHILHPSVSEAALQAGYHTMVEKPAGIDTASVLRMNQTAQAHPELTFGIMFNQRTNPLYQKIRDLVRSGEMGQLRRVTWMITTWWRPNIYFTQSPWRATWSREGGGVLTSQAPHQLDLLQWICGMPCEVSCRMKFGKYRPITVEDDVTAYLEFPNGASGVFISCTHDILGTDRLELLLDGGKILVTDSNHALIRKLHIPEPEMAENLDPEQTARIVQGGSLDGVYEESTITSDPDWAQQHCDMLASFSDSILNGTPLTAPGLEGIEEVSLTNAMYLSAWTGMPVSLPVDPQVFQTALEEQIRKERLQKET